MARPSLKTEKMEIILIAYEQCVARYGVEGATLQRVADVAGMARPLLRHYIGNQVDLLRHCSTRLVTHSAEQLSHLASIQSVSECLDRLFEVGENDQEEIAVACALMLAAPDYDFVHADMQQWSENFQQAMVATLKRLYPKAKLPSLDAVAVGLIAICSNYHTMRHLADEAFLAQSRRSAELLLSSLDDGGKQ